MADLYTEVWIEDGGPAFSLWGRRSYEDALAEAKKYFEQQVEENQDFLDMVTHRPEEVEVYETRGWKRLRRIEPAKPGTPILELCPECGRPAKVVDGVRKFHKVAIGSDWAECGGSRQRVEQPIPHDPDEPSAPEQRFQNMLVDLIDPQDPRFGQIIQMATTYAAEHLDRVLAEGLDVEVTADRRGNGFSGRVHRDAAGVLVVTPRPSETAVDISGAIDSLNRAAAARRMP